MGGKTLRFKFLRHGGKTPKKPLLENDEQQQCDDHDGDFKKKNSLYRKLLMNHPKKTTTTSKEERETPDTTTVTDVDDSQSTVGGVLSADRKSLLSELRTPQKPYRRYDDSVEDDCPCPLDNYYEFVSLFQSYKVANVKKKLFEGRRGVKTSQPDENAVELQHTSFDIDDELPFDEAVELRRTSFDIDDELPFDEPPEKKKVVHESSPSTDDLTVKPSSYFDSGNSVRKQLQGAFDSAQSGPIQNVDTSCSYEETYGDTFTSNFTKNMVNTGKRLLQFIKSETNHKWTPICVSMDMTLVETSSCGFYQPKLSIYPTQPSELLRPITLYLLDVYSIKTLPNSHSPCFTITTKSGDIYVFESPSVPERDTLTNGLKNVLSRLVFHIASGSIISQTHDDSIDESDIPPIKCPNQTLHELTMKILK